MPSLHELLKAAVRRRASDLHLTPGRKPVYRIDGRLQVDEESDSLATEDMASIIRGALPAHLLASFETNHETDFSLNEEDAGRFRVNAFLSRNGPALAIRHVKDTIPDFDELHLPPVLKDLSGTAQGIVLVCGTTGSGKSTTLAAMIQHMNRTRKLRILTIEDPVEYLFQDDQSVISQREIGLDTRSFHQALKYVLRQDPDVIMIGEMRDADSFSAALSAAETGHLVLSTLHTATASQSIARILDFFGAEERTQMRLALADNLRAVIAQRLIPSTRGGVRPAVEIMLGTPAVRKQIHEGELDRLVLAIEAGRADGMQSFNQAIYDLIREGVITEQNGLGYASNPQALGMMLKGIRQDTTSRILTQ
jgi:twitching motility protein PilT